MTYLVKKVDGKYTYKKMNIFQIFKSKVDTVIEKIQFKLFFPKSAVDCILKMKEDINNLQK